jgi:hypothetical protein
LSFQQQQHVEIFLLQHQHFVLSVENCSFVPSLAVPTVISHLCIDENLMANFMAAISDQANYFTFGFDHFQLIRL